MLAEQKLQRVRMINAASSLARTSLPEEGDDETESAGEYKLENLQPVPLSDDVLKQCRFVYHDYFKFWQLISGEDDRRSEMDIDPDYNIIDFMRKPLVKKVTSLHQLQNVYFMLHGKELDFEENG